MFTSNQIQEIINKLKICGVKDTHFNRAQLVNLTDDITIVQNNKNKVVSVQKLLDCFEEYISGGTSGSSVDFFNVSKYGMILSSVTTPVAYTLEGAIAVCPDAIKCSGQVITFLNSTDNKWYCFQYTNSNISGWSTISNWNQVFPNVIEEEDPIFSNSPAAQLTQSDVDKLGGIENEAQKNVQADWDETDSDSDAFIKNKPQSFVNVVVPTPTPVLNFGQTTTIATIDNVDVEVEMPASPSPSPSSAQKLTLTMNSSTLGEYDPFDTNPTTIDIPAISGPGLSVLPAFNYTDGDELAEIRYGDLQNFQSFKIYSNTKKAIPIVDVTVSGCSAFVTPQVYVPNKVTPGTDVFIYADEDDYKAGGDGTYRFKQWEIYLHMAPEREAAAWIVATSSDNPCKVTNIGYPTDELKFKAVYEQVAYAFEWLTDEDQCVTGNPGIFPYTYTLNKNGNPEPGPLHNFIHDEIRDNNMNWYQIGDLITGNGSYTDANSDVWTITGQSSIITPSMWEALLTDPLMTGMRDPNKIYCILEDFDTTAEIQYITLIKYVSINNPYDRQLIDKFAGGNLMPGRDEGWLIISKMPKTVLNIEQSSIGYFLSDLPNLTISHDTLMEWARRFSGNNAFLIMGQLPL